jgi:hypothetical protein
MASLEIRTPFRSFPLATSPSFALARGFQGTREGAPANHELPNQEFVDKHPLFYISQIKSSKPPFLSLPLPRYLHIPSPSHPTSKWLKKASLKTIELHIFFSILLKIVDHGFSKTTTTLKIKHLTLSPLFIYAFQFVPLTNATS